MQNNPQFNHAKILKYQIELLQTYRDDFAKYTGSQNATLLNAYFNGILGQIGRQFSHKQAQELAQMTSGDNRQLNLAIERFIAARLFYRGWLPNKKHAKLYTIAGLKRKKPHWFKQDLQTLFSMLEDKQIKPIIFKTFNLLNAKEAHFLLESRNVKGKILLINES